MFAGTSSASCLTTLFPTLLFSAILLLFLTLDESVAGGGDFGGGTETLLFGWKLFGDVFVERTGMKGFGGGMCGLNEGIGP